MDQPIHTGRAPDSDFEIAVARALQQRGFECEAQLGVAGYFIDVVVKHPDSPGGYIVGIECDGAAYHSGKSVRDRDRLRQSVLEDLGWTILRIWSTDWFRAPERETERVIKAIDLQREVDKLKAERFDRFTPRVIAGREEQFEDDEAQELAEPIPTLSQRLAGTPEAQDYFLTVEEARKQLIDLREENKNFPAPLPN